MWAGSRSIEIVTRQDVESLHLIGKSWRHEEGILEEDNNSKRVELARDRHRGNHQDVTIFVFLVELFSYTLISIGKMRG